MFCKSILVNHEDEMTTQTKPRSVLASRLRQLRTARGLSLDALAAAMGRLVSKQALSKYERGQAMPTPRVLTALARGLGVKAMSLLTPAEVEIEIIAFRKSARLGRKECARVEGLAAAMLEKRVRLQELTGEGDGSDIPVREVRASTLEACEGAADGLRERWALGRDPLANVTEVLEEHHVHVLELDADAHFDGLAAVARRPNRKVAGAAVVSKRGVPGERQRLNLAHELGHLVLDLPDSVDGEKAAFRFAGAFLAPAGALRRDVGSRRTTVSLSELLLLKQRYAISLQALVYRLRDLGVINDSHAAGMWADIKARGWKLHEPDELAPERPSWMRRAALRALAEGLLSAEEASDLLGTAGAAQTQAGMEHRRAFLKLPLAERRRILAAQAELLERHYAEHAEWRELAGAELPHAR